MDTSISFVEGKWQNIKGEEIEPKYNSQIDTQACDAGYREDLEKRGFKVELNPIAGGLGRLIPLVNQGTSYLHLKGMKRQQQHSRGRKW